MRALILLVLCLLSACGADEDITVILKNYVTRSERLSIELQSAAQPMALTQALPGDTDRFLLSLSPRLQVAKGTIKVVAVDATGCASSYGVAEVAIGQRVVEVTMHASNCDTVVEQVGLGAGEVCTSRGQCCSPNGGSCRLPSRPPGETLTAHPTLGSQFLGWNNECGTAEQCQLEVPATGARVQVVFAPPPCIGNFACWEHPSPPSEDMSGVFAASDTEIWVVTRGGSVLRSVNGIAFPKVAVLSPSPLNAVWGSRDAGVWVVGDDGAIWRYYESRWTQFFSSTCGSEPLNLKSVWGVDAKTAWMVGFCGKEENPSRAVALRWSGGASIDPVQLPTTDKPFKRLRGIWGTMGDGGQGGFIMVGDNTTILRAQDEPQGVRFETVPPPSMMTVNLTAVWGTSLESFWVGGEAGQWARFDGMNAPAFYDLKVQIAAIATVRSIWGSNIDNVWLTLDGHIILHQDRNGLSRLSDNAYHSTYYGISGSSKDSLWIVGIPGEILHWNGVFLNVVQGAPLSTALVNAIQWVGKDRHGMDEVWAIGDAGTLLHRYHGKWFREQTSTFAQLRGLSMDPNKPGDFWMAGDTGTVIHRYNNQDEIQTFGIAELSSINWRSVTRMGGYVWIAGESDIIYAIYPADRTKNAGFNSNNLKAVTFTNILAIDDHSSVAVGYTDDYSSGIFSWMDLQQAVSTRYSRPGMPLYSIYRNSVGYWIGGCEYVNMRPPCQTRIWFAADSDLQDLGKWKKISLQFPAQSPAEGVIRAIDGNQKYLWALGNQGQIWRATARGDQWQLLSYGNGVNLIALTNDPAGGNTWFAGSGGAILRRDPSFTF